MPLRTARAKHQRTLDAARTRARLDAALHPRPQPEPTPADPAPPAEPEVDAAPPLPLAGSPPARDAPRWVPDRFRGAQVVAPTQAVLVLLGVVLAAVLVTAAVLYRSRPQATAVPPPAEVVAASSAAPVRSPAGLVVSVVGKVRRPGLHNVPAGSRVADALRAAGGPLPNVDLTTLNLARKLADGEQIVVGAPVAAAPVGGSVDGSTTAPLNLNMATLEQLDALPGVGPVIAQRILDYRTSHGPFTAVDQLGDIDGIGDRTLEHLHPLVTV
jgi:competence protein ComEA